MRPAQNGQSTVEAYTMKSYVNFFFSYELPKQQNVLLRRVFNIDSILVFLIWSVSVAKQALYSETVILFTCRYYYKYKQSLALGLLSHSEVKYKKIFAIKISLLLPALWR